jgi:hypothetical protein
MKKLRRGLPRKVARTAIIIATVLAALFFGPKIMLYLHLRAARNDGLPIDPADVVAQLAISNENNAAPIYLRAGDLLKKTINHGRYFAPGQIDFVRFPKPIDIQADDRLIRNYMPVMQVAEFASEKPNIAYPRTWSEGVHLPRPEFESMRDFAILEVKKGGILAAQGDQRGALKCVEAAERISYHVGSEPDLIANLTYCKTQMEIAHTVGDVLAHVDRDPVFLKGLDAIFSKLPEPRPLSYYCRGQFVMDRATLERLPKLKEDDYDELLAGLDEEPRHNMETLLKNSYLNSIFEMNFIDYYRNLVSALPKDDSDWSALKDAANAADQAASDHSFQCCATAALSKPMYVYARSQEGMIASRRLLGTTIKVLLSKSADGKFPEELPSSGIGSVNPFDGKPFAYSHDVDGFSLSGLGPQGATQSLALTLRPLGAEPPLRHPAGGKIAKAAA